MKLRIDPMLYIVIGTLLLGLLLPISGRPAEIFDVATKVGIFVLFFGYGARLSAAETKSGLTNWKLHLTILGTTFVVFPLIAIPLLVMPGVSDPIRIGLVFLCLVPSTVQMSITMTSLAGGNVPAAMVSATASNIAGVAVTPLLTMLFFPSANGGGIGWDQALGVVVQLALPFVLGQLSRFVTANFMARHKARLKWLDQFVIAMIVYAAFSELRVSGMARPPARRPTHRHARRAGPAGLRVLVHLGAGRLAQAPEARPDRAAVLWHQEVAGHGRAHGERAVRRRHRRRHGPAAHALPPGPAADRFRDRGPAGSFGSG